MQQVVSAPQLRAGGFAPDPRISPAMGPMPNSSFPQNIASQMDYLRKNQQAKAERYEEVQPYKREKDSQELRVLQQKYEAHLNHPQDIIVTIDRLFRYLDAKAKKAELQQQNGTKKATQAVSTAHESNFTFASKTNGGQKNNNDSSTADPSTVSNSYSQINQQRTGYWVLAELFALITIISRCSPSDFLLKFFSRLAEVLSLADFL